MSSPVKKPCFVAGTVRSSGDVQTGEVSVTRGGQRTACVWSGNILTTAALTAAPGAIQSGGNVLFYSGAGRLNTVMPHAYLTSGQPVFFYDAGTPTVSGVSVSGCKLIGIIPAPYQGPLAAASGNLQTTFAWPQKIEMDMPFFSGLCASAPSGAPGFTLSYTAEVNEPAFGRDG